MGFFALSLHLTVVGGIREALHGVAILDAAILSPVPGPARVAFPAVTGHVD